MKALFIVGLMLVSGCNVGTDRTVTSDSSVCKYTDKATGVVCYFNCYFTTQSGISCVKVEGQR